MSVDNRMKTRVETDPRGVARVVDEAADGTKAVPVVFVQKDGNGGFGYDAEPAEGVDVNNRMKTPIVSDSRSTDKVVDEDINGTKAIPLVPVTKNENGEFVYTEIGGGGDDEPVTWDDVQDKPVDFPPEAHTHSISEVTGLQGELDGKAEQTHTHGISEVTGLQDELDGKLTAVQAAAQTDSTAEDVETLVGDFNALLQALRSAGIIAE